MVCLWVLGFRRVIGDFPAAFQLVGPSCYDAQFVAPCNGGSTYSRVPLDIAEFIDGMYRLLMAFSATAHECVRCVSKSRAWNACVVDVLQIGTLQRNGATDVNVSVLG